MNLKATYGTGPVGTGAHLLGYQRVRQDTQVIDAWLTVLFFPLVPIGRWRVVSPTEERLDRDAPTVALEVRSRSRPTIRPTLRRLALAIGIVMVILAPLVFGVRMIGDPWATDLVNGLLGKVPTMLASLGKFGTRLGRIVAAGIPVMGTALDLGVSVGGAALPIFVLMRLDQRTPRVSLRMVFSRRLDRAVSEDAAQ